MLNFAQRNRVVNVLRSVELHLFEARQALRSPLQTGTLFQQALNIPDERRAAVMAEIEAALGDIADLAQELALPVAEIDLARKIAGAFSVDWADLTDSTSSTLSRYGPVDPDVAQVLDSRVERLSERALAIALLVKGGRE